MLRLLFDVCKVSSHRLHIGRYFLKKIRISQMTEKIEPKTMRIDSPQFRAIFTPELMKLNEIFKKNNYELRMAGGCVRDLLMGLHPNDIDFASDATPAQMKEMFSREEIRMLNKNGEEHGTITCRIDNKENFEITTLRIDVVCDGRRAEVKFTKNWQLDANRRDLTINSLFLGLDGTVIDYFDGISDIERRKIRFVGNASQRIQEDYLRILRYFRFFGRIAPAADTHDIPTINAIKEHKDGLKNVSGERIWSELKRICVGRFGGDVITTMLETCQLNEVLALPLNADVSKYRAIFDHNLNSSIQPMTLLSSLFLDEGDLAVFHKRCKISNVEKSVSELIIQKREEAVKNSGNMKYWHGLILDEERTASCDKTQKTGRERVLELARYIKMPLERIEELALWKMPVFPIGGRDIMESGIERGPKIKAILDHLFSLWKESECSLTKEDLIPHIYDDGITFETKLRRNRSKKRKHSGSPQ
ncbi:hypothetical protein AB6A40_000942 [Gnathostoma spinigerum]|uniref:Poly A polymerase head domain-containing protein n=1 Tax=Gnathostoma spinigerum TaxID=75299 RepID=A0ABD6EBR7_9BILA